MGALTATAQPKYHAGVEPMLPGFNYAPFGDLDAVEKAIDGETCAVMLEPIQGEGGINVPPAGFLEGLRELCDKHGLLLILDEVQTGMGRTGKWYAYQHWGVKPDIVTLAKALAGGVAMGGLDREAGGRREAQARHARRDLRRQPARRPRRARHHRDDRGREPARPRRADRREVPGSLHRTEGEVPARHGGAREGRDDRRRTGHRGRGRGAGAASRRACSSTARTRPSCGCSRRSPSPTSRSTTGCDIIADVLLNLKP